MTRMQSFRPSFRTPGGAGRSPYTWRPDPCLFIEFQECFYTKSVRLRWHNLPGLASLGDDAMIEIDSQPGGTPLDPAFFDDVADVIFHWLSFYSGFDREAIHAAFRVNVCTPSDKIPNKAPGRCFIEVAPVPQSRDLPFMLIALRDNGASIKPTLH